VADDFRPIRNAGETAALEDGVILRLFPFVATVTGVRIQCDRLSGLLMPRRQDDGSPLVVDADGRHFGLLGEALDGRLHLVEAIEQHAVVRGAFDQPAGAFDLGVDKPEEVLLRGAEAQEGVDGQHRRHGDGQRHEKSDLKGTEKGFEPPGHMTCLRARRRVMCSSDIE
jgi:hypothetical protein